jgi:O-antigen/teichoic acid export membrane protein
MKKHAAGHRPYVRLSIMAVLSFISMYILMYAMVDVFANVYSSLNQAYMAALMTAPMLVIELILMWPMYPDARFNGAIIAFSLVALVASFLLIREQTLIGNTQFLRSMIPHHAGAILMCEEAPIVDSEIKTLCEKIKSSQQSEIDQMKAILSRLRNPA